MKISSHLSIITTLQKKRKHLQQYPPAGCADVNINSAWPTNKERPHDTTPSNDDSQQQHWNETQHQTTPSNDDSQQQHWNITQHQKTPSNDDSQQQHWNITQHQTTPSNDDSQHQHWNETQHQTTPSNDDTTNVELRGKAASLVW
ncbi:hypothetical protein Pcinc_035926 [Petrolisthes cinctipes]|uniref:Uncharacterized protein n=1 Tax=Petrolisthes cinctipes TaxID=88211 RepID=A0AAE1BVI9_PETCI|nr:hypothetical protein Pcinc_035926 [Petrolisthes cinctipes]